MLAVKTQEEAVNPGIPGLKGWEREETGLPGASGMTSPAHPDRHPGTISDSYLQNRELICAVGSCHLWAPWHHLQGHLRGDPHPHGVLGCRTGQEPP